MKPALAVALVAVVPACGSDDDVGPGPDGGITGGCQVTFSGNYDETQAVPECAHITHGTLLELTVPSTTIHTDYAISIDFGATPVPGTYTTQTVAGWASLATEEVSLTGECLFSAGNTAVPNGSFTLALDGVSPPSGQLTIVHYVLALPMTTCGAGDTETVDIHF